MKIRIQIQIQIHLLAVSASLLLAGCSPALPSDPSIQIWGSRGRTPGRFAAPRAIHARGGLVYVIDRSGRVQKFDADGSCLLVWELEKYDNGTPTGVSIDESGNVWIPDTHNSRILEYSSEGKWLLTFGEYGEAPGKFIYPTAIAFGEGGELFITEYGVHDRVQVFSRAGQYLNRTWGDFGAGEDQFNRPMGIVKAPDGLLYITDAVNHRVKVYTQRGERVRIFGRAGTGAGELQFPYAIDADGNGNLWIADYGNHRVQIFAPDGSFLGSWGHPGSGPGELAEPWGVTVDGDRFYVADTKNHRIQSAPLLVFPTKGT
ncbi:MAG: hypothetical protein ACE15F_22300 [bacterium]